MSTSGKVSTSSMSIYDEKTARLAEYEYNKIIVRVWLSHVDSKQFALDRIGHVSVAARQIYMSICPKHQEKKEISVMNLVYRGVPSVMIADYEDDKKAEGDAVPEYTFYFYSLNARDIEIKFQEFQEKNWSLLALKNDSASCASMAFDLLVAGGIKKLAGKVAELKVSSSGSSRGSSAATSYLSSSIVYGLSSNMSASQEASAKAAHASLQSLELAASLGIKSPDGLAEFLKKAKAEEIRLYPLTQKFSDNGWQPEAPGMCCML